MSANELTKIISPAFTYETLREILKNKSKFSDFVISNILLDEGSSKKGDSYLSSMCKFTIKASGKDHTSGDFHELTVPVIVKYFPKNEARRKTFRSPDFFKTEIYFYEKIWPEMKQIKLNRKLDETDEVPLFLASHCDGKVDFIALEDLSHQNFKTFGRTDVISRETLSLLLNVVANFHALGLVAKTQNPDFESKAKAIPESYFADKYRSWYENFMYKSLGPQLQRAVEEILPSNYHEKLTNFFSGDLYGRVIDSCNSYNKFSTVTQGDAWLPNFLIKSDKDGNNTEAIFIDFQLARYGYLTNDLLNILLTGAPSEMLLKDWDSLIEEYHQYLSERIDILGGDKTYITLEELRQGLEQHSLVGLIMSMESFTMALLTDDEVADIDLLEGEEAHPIENVWLFPKYDRARNERLAVLVKFAVDRGFLK